MTIVVVSGVLVVSTALRKLACRMSTDLQTLITTTTVVITKTTNTPVPIPIGMEEEEPL